MTGINVTGVGMGTTDVKLTAGKIQQTVPVEVKSANLLRYGPLNMGGLDVSVNEDGSLHLKGALDQTYRFLFWEFPLSDVANPGDVLAYWADKPFTQSGASVVLAQSGKPSVQITDSGVVVPDTTTKIQFRIVVRKDTDLDLKFAVYRGTTPPPWMRPDDTSYEGGGGEVVNLFPDLPTQTQNGVTLTRVGDHQWKIVGTPTKSDNFGASIPVEPGEYRLTSVKSSSIANLTHVQVSTPGGRWISNNGTFVTDKSTKVRCQFSCNVVGTPLDGTISDVLLTRID